LLEPGKKNSEFTIHEKVKLVPFSERAPYVEQLPFLSKLIRWGVGISAWQRGTRLTEFVMNNPAGKQNTKFITLICFESVFSDYVREGIKNGAEFISIITNDGWFGNSSGPVQHDRYAVLRAIENRKWIIRAAQTGISDFIDPLGNQYEKTELETEALISKTIIANSEVTFYAENGDIIGKAGYYTMIICLLSGIILYAVRRKKSKLA
jgi:apolipoprotein N-acyltransferase